MDINIIKSAKSINGNRISKVIVKNNVAYIVCDIGTIAIAYYISDDIMKKSVNFVNSGSLKEWLTNFSSILAIDKDMQKYILSIYTPSLIMKSSSKTIPRYNNIKDKCSYYSFADGVTILNGNIITNLYDINDTTLADNEDKSPWIFLWTSDVDKTNLLTLQRYYRMSNNGNNLSINTTINNKGTNINIMICNVSSKLDISKISLVY